MFFNKFSSCLIFFSSGLLFDNGLNKYLVSLKLTSSNHG